MEGQQPPLYGEPPVGGEEGDPKEGGEGEPGEYPEYEDDDKLIDTFSVKDGGPIPLLQVTMTCIFKIIFTIYKINLLITMQKHFFFFLKCYPI